MPFDALTMAAVADELRDKVVGGRIQGVFLPAPLAIGLEIYAHHETHFLFISAHPQHARLHLAESKLTRGTEDVTPLLLLLRKYVRDGRLAAVEQPPLERTVSLIITKADVFDKGQGGPHPQPLSRQAPTGEGVGGEGLDRTTVTIIVEIMGRYSNIILVDDAGVVMEAVKHISSEINRYRVTLPRHPYALPPPQNKADPRGLSAAALSHTLSAASDQPAWQVLVRSYLGVSPLLAREAVFRAAGAADAACAAAAPDALASSLSALLTMQYAHQWSPTLARDDGAILEFAPYVLTQFGGRAFPADSISAAIHAFYAQETVASDYAGLKQDIQKALDVQRKRIMRRSESLHTQQEIGAQADALRTKGEMLLAYSAQIAPGQREAVLEMSPGSPPLHIALQPRLSAVQNAQEYFKRYTQARDAARTLPPLLAQAALDLAFLDQVQLDLEMAKTAADLREVKKALAETGGQRVETPGKGDRPPRPATKMTPITVNSDDGMQIIVGRNALQNDYVTFEAASSLDLWLHARGVAGSHVIVRSGGRPVSAETLAQAASLAAAHSAARASTTVTVDHTQRRNVHRARGGGPGMVTYINEKTIHVRPARD